MKQYSVSLEIKNAAGRITTMPFRVLANDKAAAKVSAIAKALAAGLDVITCHSEALA